MTKYGELALLAALRNCDDPHRLLAHHPDAARLTSALKSAEREDPFDVVWREVLEVVQRPPLPENPPALTVAAAYFWCRQVAGGEATW